MRPRWQATWPATCLPPNGIDSDRPSLPPPPARPPPTPACVFLGPRRFPVKGPPGLVRTRLRCRASDPNPPYVRRRERAIGIQQARPQRRMIVEPLHRGDRLERRIPVADQRRWPGNGHEVVEGEPDEEDQGRGI